jgi:hypothetical protein
MNDDIKTIREALKHFAQSVELGSDRGSAITALAALSRIEAQGEQAQRIVTVNGKDIVSIVEIPAAPPSAAQDASQATMDLAIAVRYRVGDEPYRLSIYEAAAEIERYVQSRIAEANISAVKVFGPKVDALDKLKERNDV